MQAFSQLAQYTIVYSNNVTMSNSTNYVNYTYFFAPVPVTPLHACVEFFLIFTMYL